MSDVDVNQQWRELQENYAAMSDEELETVAQDAYDLTDVARQALQAEIARRDLRIELQQSAATPDEPASPEPETETESETELDSSQLTDLQRVWSLDEAKQLKETLDWAGVPVFFGPERVEDLAMLNDGFEHGVDVRVRDFDQQRATAALAQAAAKKEQPQENAQEETPYTPHCPRCHSTEIVFQSLDLDPGTTSAFDSKYNWSCEACGYQWKDDGIESET